MASRTDAEPTDKPLLFAWRDAILASDLHATTRHVLLTLSLHMDMDGGEGWPSTRRLSSETGRSRRTVETHLRDAEAAGWLDREQRGEGRGWRRHVYRPRIPDDPEGGEGVSPARDEGGETVSPRQSGRGERGSPRQPPEGGEGDSPPHPRRGEIDDADVGKEFPTTSSCTSPEDRNRGGGSSLRSSPPPSGDGDEDSSHPDEPSGDLPPWGLDELPNGDAFPSRFFLEGVEAVLWLGKEPPDDAPADWEIRAELPDLRTAWRNIGTERLVRGLRGLRYLADAGEMPGVDPGEGFTLGLLKRLRGRGLWEAAEAAYRDRHDPPDEGGLLDELASGVLDGEAADG